MGTLAALAVTAWAGSGPATEVNPAGFEHVATFDVNTNGTISASDVVLTDDGTVAVYTDPEAGRLGFVDLSDPVNARSAGSIALDGRPMDVAIHGQQVFITVDTSESTMSPAGHLIVIDLRTRTPLTTLDLRGQPDGLSIDPTGTRGAIVVENQRDNAVNDGALPQGPGGRLVVADFTGPPAQWLVRDVALTGLDMAYPDDPEPEDVAISADGTAVVTLQENNHLAIVDLHTATVIDDFSAGSVDLTAIDTVEEELGPHANGRSVLAGPVNRRREPGAVAWIDDHSFLIVNEGDYREGDGSPGGSRGFSVVGRDGDIRFESGSAFEHEVIRVGQYDESRSSERGIEPEAVSTGSFEGRSLVAVSAHRGNVVGVYERVGDSLVSRQMLPTGERPSGIAMAPDAGLMVVAAEGRHEDDEYPSMITVYRYDSEPASMTSLRSTLTAAGEPIAWTALSALAADPARPGLLYAVNDSSLAEAAIAVIDTRTSPASVVDRILVRDLEGVVLADLDIEGVASDPRGGLWAVSEARAQADSARELRVIHIDPDGVVIEQLEVPHELSSPAADEAGTEAIALQGTTAVDALYIAHQQPVAGDPPGLVRIYRYEVATQRWTVAWYQLESGDSSTASRVVVSDLSITPDGHLAVLERDNLAGPRAKIKQVFTITVSPDSFVELGTAPPAEATVDKALLADLLPRLEAESIWTPNKPEGLAFGADGTMYVVTDNDGLNDSLGHTVLLSLDVD